MEKLSVIIAEDDKWYAQFIKHAIELTGDHDIKIVGTAKEMLQSISSSTDIVTLDFNLPDEKGGEVLDKIKSKNHTLEVIVISGQEDVQTAINLLNKGAFDYVVKNDEARNRIVQALRSIEKNKVLKKQITHLENEVRIKYDFKDTIISNSKKFDKVYELIHKAAESNINVSIYGKTGTGKELVAKAIHYNSKRAKHPFIAVNLTSLSDSLLESELFGFVKGAFTGATQDRRGKFEEAGQGTIFLDEIAEINETVQVKLLRVLQELEISKVGSNKIVSLRCRIICATNKDLAEEVRKGNFRQDLFYRLMGLPINLPRLIERDNDILVLSKHFSADFAKKNNTKLYSLSDRAITKLNNYHYPGNVRELKSIIDLACVLSSGEMIDQDDIVFNDLSDDFSAFEFKNQTLKQHNKSLIEGMLNKHNNNVRLVAEKLGIGKSTIYRIIK
jgi:two-component system response regulator AtoC